MPTVTDLVTRALRKATVIAAGETPDANDVNDALETLNDILDQWCLEDLMLFYTKVISIPLSANVNTYTIGPSVAATVAGDRPVEVLQAYIRDALGLDTQLQIVDFSTYQTIVQKSTTGAYPTILTYQPTPTDGTIIVWQNPIAGLTLRIVVSALLANVTLSTELDLPVGYSKAIVDALRYEIMLEHGNGSFLEEAKETSRISKMNVKRKNSVKTSMRLDASFFPSSNGNSGTYNYNTDI